MSDLVVGPDDVECWRRVGSTNGKLHFKKGCQYAGDEAERKALSSFTADYDKCSLCWPTVSTGLRQVMRDEEIQNIRHFEGWAIGTIVLAEKKDGRRLRSRHLISEKDRVEKCWIELFNGKGRAGEFGGVKAFAIRDAGAPHTEEYPVPGYFETYAFAHRDAFVESSQEGGWYVEEWETPEEPDYGEAAP